MIAAALAFAVTIEWAASISPNVYAYAVYRSCTAMPPYSGMVASIHGDRVTDPIPLSFEDDPLEYGQTCTYSLTTIDTDGNESTPIDAGTITLPNRAPPGLNAS